MVNKKTVSARKVSTVTGVNYCTLKRDIELKRIDAFYYEGRYYIEVADILDYAEYLLNSNRAVLIYPLSVIQHRIDYLIFRIYE